MSGLIGHRGLLLRGVAGGGGGASTWNPADKDADVSLSGADLVATLTGAVGSVRGITARDAAGDWYFEVTIGGEVPSGAMAGIGQSGSSLAVRPGFAPTSYGYLRRDNDTFNNGAAGSSDYLSALDTVGVLVDFTAGTLTLKRAGRFYTHAFSSISGTLYPMWGPGSSGASTRAGTLNTGGSAFVLGLPVGATAWGGTWNSADKSANVTLSGSDLIATVNSGGGSVRGTQGRSSGVYYFEITRSAGDSVWLGGAGNSSADLSTYPGANTNSWAYYRAGDEKYTNNTGSAMPAQKSTVVIGVWLKAGGLKFIGDGHVGPNAYTGLSGNYYAMWGGDAIASQTGTANFAGPFNWQPAGSTAWG
jgi:hypothetical protein